MDAYVRDHPDRDRDTVIDEALRIWLDLAREQDQAMEEQFANDDIPKASSVNGTPCSNANARLMLRRDHE